MCLVNAVNVDHLPDGIQLSFLTLSTHRIFFLLYSACYVNEITFFCFFLLSKILIGNVVLLEFGKYFVEHNGCNFFYEVFLVGLWK